MIDIPVFRPAFEADIELSIVDLTTLGEDDLARFDAVATEKRRREKAAASVAVSRLLGDDAVITHCPDGHPCVEGRAGSLSVSHAGNLLVAAFSPSHVLGVDIEYPREALRRVASKFLSERERRQYDTLPRLLRAWTIKEAVYKAALQKGLSLFDIVLPEPDEASPVAEVRASAGIVRFNLYYSTVGDAMLTLAVRADA